jgi:hypothetical protein
VTAIDTAGNTSASSLDLSVAVANSLPHINGHTLLGKLADEVFIGKGGLADEVFIGKGGNVTYMFSSNFGNDPIKGFEASSSVAQSERDFSGTGAHVVSCWLGCSYFGRCK